MEPTAEELEKLESEAKVKVRVYRIYHYLCQHPECNHRFLSNLPFPKAICPYTPKFHPRKGARGFLSLRDKSLIVRPVQSWMGSEVVPV